MKELHTQPIMGFKQKCRCNWKSPSQEPHSKFSVTNQRTKIFGKTLQTLARDSNRSLGLRRGRLMTKCCVPYSITSLINIKGRVRTSRSDRRGINWSSVDPLPSSFVSCHPSLRPFIQLSSRAS